MDKNLVQEIERLKTELLNLYDMKKNLRDPDVLNKSIEIERFINQYQKGSLSLSSIRRK